MVLMNKKGLTISGVTEAVVLALICIVCFTGILVDLDYHYAKNHAGSLDLPNATIEQLQQATGTLKNTTESGEASTTASGLSLSSSWALVLAIWSIIWRVVAGGWITALVVGAMHATAGAYLIGYAIQAMYLFGLVLAVVRIFFRVRP